MSKKYIFDSEIISSEKLSDRFSIIGLTVPADITPEVLPGQFLEVKIPDAPSTYLRRPISICDYEADSHRLTLLVRRAGEGTETLCNLPAGSRVNIVGPLGHGFSIPAPGSKALLVGGGVGVAPLLLLGKAMKNSGVDVKFLLGARTAREVLLLDRFQAVGHTGVATDDGSLGEKGFVHQHSLLRDHYDLICTCGPKPMMLGVARMARKTDSPCEVSLENLMACGLGACLCCVEPTLKGNLRACVEGPVFSTDLLMWNLDE